MRERFNHVKLQVYTKQVLDKTQLATIFGLSNDAFDPNVPVRRQPDNPQIYTASLKESAVEKISEEHPTWIKPSNHSYFPSR